MPAESVSVAPRVELHCVLSRMPALSYPWRMVRTFSLFMMIFLFAGSLVLVAANDIRKRLPPPSAAQEERMRNLITHLRHETILPPEKEFVEEARKPPRKPGSYLPDTDWARLKRAILSVVSSSEPEEQK